ncbi:MAG TPA: alpha/beta hydrolase domain-containing protein [Vicinamibacterales bacterium]|nr:alpha/beta hydrolase domain-containing protein [Vicinamibacterales bacterium]
MVLSVVIRGCAIALAMLLLTASRIRADVPEPAVEGPIPYSAGLWGFPWSSVPDLAELSALGYIEQEFFFSGTIGTQPYTSRMIVRLPSDPDRFNGTVLVEWLNVTTGADIAVDWALARRQIVRDGYAYVAVSAQPVGVCWLKTWDSVRYATLNHPALPPGPCPASDQTETFSYDIFSQAGKAIRDNPLVLGGLDAARLLAAGASQSARRLLNYVNAHHATAQVFDGFLLHVIGGGGGGQVMNTTAPVLILNSENEVLGYYPYRGLQPGNVRYWEIAGAGHTPELAYLIDQLQHAGVTLVINCEYPTSDALIPMYPVGDAALDALKRWLTDGTAPADSALVTVLPGTPNTIARDQHGNALGGIRLPQIESPLGRFTGTNAPPTLACRVVGGFDLFNGEPAGTTPNDTWDEPTLKELYRNHGAYVSAFAQAVDRLLALGFMLEPDAELAKARAAGSAIGK